MCRRRRLRDNESSQEKRRRKEITHYSTCFSSNCETFPSFASRALMFFVFHYIYLRPADRLAIDSFFGIFHRSDWVAFIVNVTFMQIDEKRRKGTIRDRVGGARWGMTGTFRRRFLLEISWLICFWAQVVRSICIFLRAASSEHIWRHSVSFTWTLCKRVPAVSISINAEKSALPRAAKFHG